MVAFRFPKGTFIDGPAQGMPPNGRKKIAYVVSMVMSEFALRPESFTEFFTRAA
jgi:hypothetical protein